MEYIQREQQNQNRNQFHSMETKQTPSKQKFQETLFQNIYNQTQESDVNSFGNQMEEILPDNYNNQQYKHANIYKLQTSIFQLEGQSQQQNLRLSQQLKQNLNFQNPYNKSKNIEEQQIASKLYNKSQDDLQSQISTNLTNNLLASQTNNQNLNQQQQSLLQQQSTQQLQNQNQGTQLIHSLSHNTLQIKNNQNLRYSQNSLNFSKNPRENQGNQYNFNHSNNNQIYAQQDQNESPTFSKNQNFAQQQQQKYQYQQSEIHSPSNSNLSYNLQKKKNLFRYSHLTENEAAFIYENRQKEILQDLITQQKQIKKDQKPKIKNTSKQREISAFDKSPKQSNQISSFFNKEEIPNEQKKYPFIIFNDSKNNARGKKKSITNILSPKNSVKDFSISNQVSQTPNNLQFSQSQTQFSMFPKSSTNNNNYHKNQYINFTQHYRESQSFYKANQTSQVNQSEQMKTLQRSKSIEHISNNNQQLDNQQLLTSKEQIQKEFKQFQLQREKQNQINNLSKNLNFQKMLSQQQCLTISDQISNPETSKSANEQFPFYAQQNSNFDLNNQNKNYSLSHKQQLQNYKINININQSQIQNNTIQSPQLSPKIDVSNTNKQNRDQIQNNPNNNKNINNQMQSSNPISKNKYGENYTQFDTYRSLQQSQSPFINLENQNKNVDVSISKFNSQTGKHSEIHFPPQSQEHMMILSNPKSLQNYYYNKKNQIQQALSETLTQQSNTVNTYQSEENSFEINKEQVVQKKPKKQTQFDLQGNQVFEHDPNAIPKQKKTQSQLNQIKIQSLMKKKQSYPQIKVEKGENKITTQEQLKESRYQTQIKDDIDNLDNQIAKLKAEMIVIDKPDSTKKLNQLLQQQLNKKQNNEEEINKQNLEGNLKSPTRKQESFNLTNVKQQSAKNLQQQLKAEKQINLPLNNKQFKNQNQKKDLIKQSNSANNIKKNSLKSNIKNIQKKSQATPINLRQIKNSNLFYSPETKKNSKTVQSLKQKKISFYDQTNLVRQNQSQLLKNQNYQRENFSTSPTPLNQRKYNVYEQSQPMTSKSQASQQNKNIFHKKNKTQKSAQFIKQLDKDENDYTFQYNINNKQHPQTQTKACKNNDILELQKSQEFKVNQQNEEIDALEFELLEKQINQQTQKESQCQKQNLAPHAQFNLYAKKSMEIFRSTSPQVKPSHRKINSQIPYSNQDLDRGANINNPYNNQENKIKYHSTAQKNNQQKEISNKNIKNVTKTLKLPQKQKYFAEKDKQQKKNNQKTNQQEKQNQLQQDRNQSPIQNIQISKFYPHQTLQIQKQQAQQKSIKSQSQQLQVKKQKLQKETEKEKNMYFKQKQQQQLQKNQQQIQENSNINNQPINLLLHKNQIKNKNNNNNQNPYRHGGYLDVQYSPNLSIDPQNKQNGINSERYGDKGKLNFQKLKQQQQQRYNTSLNSSFRQKKQNTNDELSPTNPSQFLKIIQKRNQQQKQNETVLRKDNNSQSERLNQQKQNENNNTLAQKPYINKDFKPSVSPTSNQININLHQVLEKKRGQNINLLSKNQTLSPKQNQQSKQISQSIQDKVTFKQNTEKYSALIQKSQNLIYNIKSQNSDKNNPKLEFQ